MRNYDDAQIPSLLVGVSDFYGLKLPGFINDELKICRGLFTLDLPSTSFNHANSNGAPLDVDFKLINGNADPINYRLYLKDHYNDADLYDGNNNNLGDFEQGVLMQPGQIDYGFNFVCPDTNRHILTIGIAPEDGNGNVVAQLETKYEIAIDCGFSRTYKKLAAGQDHAMAIDENGSVWVWGNNRYGQLGNEGTSAYDGMLSYDLNGTRALEVSTFLHTNLAVDDQGRAWSWGYSDNGETGHGAIAYDPNRDPDVIIRVTKPFIITFPPEADKIVSVAMGGQHGLALDANGTVWAWGATEFGQLGNGVSSPDLVNYEPSPAQPSPVKVRFPAGVKIRQIAAGAYSSYAIDEIGKVWAWGANSSGELGGGSYDTFIYTPHDTPVQIAMNASPSMLAVAGNPSRPSYRAAVTSASASHWQSVYPQQVMALDGVGAVWRWGAGVTPNHDAYTRFADGDNFQYYDTSKYLTGQSIINQSITKTLGNDQMCEYSESTKYHRMRGASAAGLGYPDLIENCSVNAPLKDTIWTGFNYIDVGFAGDFDYVPSGYFGYMDQMYEEMFAASYVNRPQIPHFIEYAINASGEVYYSGFTYRLEIDPVYLANRTFDKFGSFHYATMVHVTYRKNERLYFPNFARIKQISASKNGKYFGYAIAVDENGDLYGWGFNMNKQLQLPLINETLCDPNAGYAPTLSPPYDRYAQCYVYEAPTKMNTPTGVKFAH